LPRSRRRLFDFVRECTFCVGDSPIEYVESFVHLGHVITSHLVDNDDILQRCNDFVGQANNVLCFFSKLKSSVVYKLFQSYCMSLYGCELWLLSNTCLEDLCVSWRKCLRRVWRLPYTTHCYLLPLICECLSLEDEICRRSLHFIRECLCNSSRLVNAIASFGIYYGRYDSVLGHNALFCANKFNMNVCDMKSEAKVRRAIERYSATEGVNQQLQAAGFLRELLLLRDDYLVFSNNVIFTRDELTTLIDETCIN